MSKQCIECSKPVVAGGLCETHYRRIRRHGHLQQTRPPDWGNREKHSLYGSWCWFRKGKNNLVTEWRDNFWKFVDDVGERPTNQHRLSRKDRLDPLGPLNFEWVLVNKTPRSNKEYQKKYRLENPEKAKNSYLKRQYGMSLNQYSELLEKQQNVCAICGGIDLVALAVDHCHTTGKIRGLLCTNCNKLLGHAKDNIDVLCSAIEYLKTNTIPHRMGNLMKEI